MIILKTNQESINKAVRILKQGGVVVCPTDTVYGFLADASNKKAVEKIFKIKGRPKEKPLPVFVKDLADAKKIALISKDQESYIKKFWPGSVTFVLQRKKPGLITVPLKVYGVDKKTIAIRVPRHKFLSGLLKKINRPLAQTSVNISGEEPLNSTEAIYNQFKTQKNQPDLIIDTGKLKGRPSKIVDLRTGQAVLRN
jgi:L-threonylcarbamoyladenylate synthase